MVAYDNLIYIFHLLLSFFYLMEKKTKKKIIT